MGKKVKKGLNIATFGLSGVAEKLAVDPIKAGFGYASSALGMAPAGASGTTNEFTGSTAAPDTTPTAMDPDTLAAREAQKKRQLAAAGLSGNILTGAQGLTSPASTNMKSLLGS